MSSGQVSHLGRTILSVPHAQTRIRTLHPDQASKVPDRPEWIHEVKHDGYRLIVQRDGKRVRLFTLNGHDWSAHYPLIVEAADEIVTARSCSMAMPCCSASTVGLHSRRHDDEVEFYADCLVADGDDLRKLPLSMRMTNLARLPAGRPDGIHAAPFELGRDRSRSVPACLPDGAGGLGQQAPLRRRPVRSLAR
jgi:bifunctional non-homologous end joining protein LigD